jgi:hypothetical protein
MFKQILFSDGMLQRNGRCYAAKAQNQQKKSYFRSNTHAELIVEIAYLRNNRPVVN